MGYYNDSTLRWTPADVEDHKRDFGHAPRFPHLDKPVKQQPQHTTEIGMDHTVAEKIADALKAAQPNAAKYHEALDRALDYIRKGFSFTLRGDHLTCQSRRSEREYNTTVLACDCQGSQRGLFCLHRALITIAMTYQTAHAASSAVTSPAILKMFRTGEWVEWLSDVYQVTAPTSRSGWVEIMDTEYKKTHYVQSSELTRHTPEPAPAPPATAYTSTPGPKRTRMSDAEYADLCRRLDDECF